MTPWNAKRVRFILFSLNYNELTLIDRVIDLQHIADKTEAEAWKAVKQASDERDIHDFKEAVQVLVKACPEMTYPELEKEFRKRNFNVYLIALVSLTISNLTTSSLTHPWQTGERPRRHTHFYQPTRRAGPEVCRSLLLERQGSASKHERALAKVRTRKP